MYYFYIYISINICHISNAINSEPEIEKKSATTERIVASFIALDGRMTEDLACNVLMDLNLISYYHWAEFLVISVEKLFKVRKKRIPCSFSPHRIKKVKWAAKQAP